MTAAITGTFLIILSKFARKRLYALTCPNLRRLPSRLASSAPRGTESRNSTPDWPLSAAKALAASRQSAFVAACVELADGLPARCALLPDRNWLLHFLESSFADEAIVADALDVEQAR
jgi:hypothetical protein